MSEFPIYGICYKFNTENSELFEYKPGYFICKANVCWTEEVERDSGRHIRKRWSLDQYRQLIARVLPRAGGS